MWYNELSYVLLIVHLDVWNSKTHEVSAVCHSSMCIYVQIKALKCHSHIGGGLFSEFLAYQHFHKILSYSLVEVVLSDLLPIFGITGQTSGRDSVYDTPHFRTYKLRLHVALKPVSIEPV